VIRAARHGLTLPNLRKRIALFGYLGFFLVQFPAVVMASPPRCIKDSGNGIVEKTEPGKILVSEYIGVSNLTDDKRAIIFGGGSAISPPKNIKLWMRSWFFLTAARNYLRFVDWGLRWGKGHGPGTPRLGTQVM